MEPNFIIEFIVTHLVPFVAFFAGVIIAETIGLYPKLQRKHVWLMSVPTGFVSTGILISSASVQLSGVTHYGYMSLEKYFIFIGTIMFYGTAAPELFAAFRGRLRDGINNK